MLKIVPSFQKIFKDFGTTLPAMTQTLIVASNLVANYWYLLPGIPTSIWLAIKLIRKFKGGRMGWDMFTLKIPIFQRRR
jgi:type IV pilus assembly protein PilC